MPAAKRVVEVGDEPEAAAVALEFLPVQARGLPALDISHRDAPWAAQSSITPAGPESMLRRSIGAASQHIRLQGMPAAQTR